MAPIRTWPRPTRGGSALHYVVRGGGNPQLIQALLDHGLDINAKDEDGLSALDYAMGRGYVPLLQMTQPPNNPLAASLRKLGANVELDAIPDWPPQGPPIATAVYASVLWPDSMRRPAGTAAPSSATRSRGFTPAARCTLRCSTAS